jgi:two-component system response regulator MprA
VLVIDDERPIRELVAETLWEAGYEVEAASNGAEALERIGGWQPDVVVLDLMMPVLDAAGFLRLLRLDPSSAHVRIVILTAAYAPYEQAHRLGAAACLTKPFSLEELVAAVEQAACDGSAVISG